MLDGAKFSVCSQHRLRFVFAMAYFGTYCSLCLPFFSFSLYSAPAARGSQGRRYCMILPWIVFSLAFVFLFLIVLSSGNQSFLFFVCLFFCLCLAGVSNGFQIRYHSVQEFFSSMAEEGLVVSTFSFFLVRWVWQARVSGLAQNAIRHQSSPIGCHVNPIFIYSFVSLCIIA